MTQSNPQDYFNQFNENTQKMLQPWSKLNKAFVKNAEMMTEFSLDTMRSYSEMGLENMRQVADIGSPETAKDFSNKQVEMLNSISQKMLADAQRLTDLGNSMQDEIMKVMGEVYGQTNEQLQATMQQTADQATKTAQEYAENMSKMAEQVTEKMTEQASKVVKSATPAAPTANESKAAAKPNANKTEAKKV